jgi:flagella basal body P-ring formation protein FlgA
MVARVADEAPLSFNVSADIDEFREVPVAARPVERGMRISDSDVMYARMNIAQLPVDALRDEEEIVGQEVKGSLGYGDIFRRRSLHIPPVIKAGSPVSIQFSSPLLVATASGTAIEAGAQDELIRVRNEASKRVFQARVLAPGLVEVNE